MKTLAAVPAGEMLRSLRTWDSLHDSSDFCILFPYLGSGHTGWYEKELGFFVDVVFFLFVFVLFFETGFLCVALAVLELSL